MSNKLEIIGQTLRSIRNSLKMTQKEFAGLFFATDSSVSKIEVGKRCITDDQIALLEANGIDMGEIKKIKKETKNDMGHINHAKERVIFRRTFNDLVGKNYIAYNKNFFYGKEDVYKAAMGYYGNLDNKIVYFFTGAHKDTYFCVFVPKAISLIAFLRIKMLVNDYVPVNPEFVKKWSKEYNPFFQAKENWNGYRLEYLLFSSLKCPCNDVVTPFYKSFTGSFIGIYFNFRTNKIYPVTILKSTEISYPKFSPIDIPFTIRRAKRMNPSDNLIYLLGLDVKPKERYIETDLYPDNADPNEFV